MRLLTPLRFIRAALLATSFLVAGCAGAPPPAPASDHAGQDPYAELLRIGRLRNASGDSAAAETAYRRALEIQEHNSGAASLGAGQTLAALALEVSNQDRFEEASMLFRRAEPIIERAGNVADQARLAAYQALDAANQHDYGQALQRAHEASTLRRGWLQGLEATGGAVSKGLANGELVHSLVLEAAMSLRLDDLPSAEATVTEAMEIIAVTPDLPPWWRPRALALIGEINARQGRLPVAERQIRDAIAWEVRLFGETGPAAFTYMILGRIYAEEEMPAEAIDAYRHAFSMLERAPEARSGVDFDRLAPFLRTAASLAERDPGQRPDLEADMFRAIQLAGGDTVDLSAFRSKLRRNEAFAAFRFGHKTAWVVLVNQDRLLARPIALDRATLGGSVRELRRAFQAPLKSPPEFNLGDAHALYRSLLGPVEDGLPGVEHLIASASGPLASLPLGLLVTEPPAGKTYREAAFLIRRMAISAIPSVRSFQTLRTGAGTKPALLYRYDGPLDASEIASLHLNADLVVLSASGIGGGSRNFGGDALSGLAESFFLGGARGLLASHWQTPPDDVAPLMAGLSKRFQEQGAAEALRQAQLTLLDQPATAHPFFWAAFTVIGDGAGVP